MEKPAWSACAHQTGGPWGCGIWGEHPASCRRYACLWRASDALLPPDMFPPGGGFLVTMETPGTWPAVVNVCVDPRRAAAWDNPRNRDIFARLASAWNCPVVVVEEGTRASHVFAPTGGFYSRAERPELFPGDGAGLALANEDYGPDRRPPAERIAEAAFSWRQGG